MQTTKTNKKIALFIAAITSFSVPFMGSSINIALPSIGKEFVMDAITLGWVASSFLLANATFMVPFGRVADIYGRKKIFTVGLAIYTVFSLLTAFSWSSTVLITFRVLQGLGAAIFYGPLIAILTSIFPPNERGRVLGFNAASVYTGLSLGPVLGGFMTQHFGWTSIFFFGSFLGILSFSMSLWNLKGEWIDARGESMDYIGSVLYMVCLTSIMYGFSQLPNLHSSIFIVVGIITLILFVLWEMRTPFPVLSINLFRINVSFAFSTLAALINYIATFGIGFLLSLYLQYIKGYNPSKSGFILVTQPLLMAILSPIAGRLSDKIEPRIVSSLGMGLTVLGLVLLVFIHGQTCIVYIIISQAILGTGFALFAAPNTNAIHSSVNKKLYGVASGIVGTARGMGQMLSLTIVTLIFALVIGRVQIKPDNYSAFLQSMQIVFIIFTILCFLGIFASLARGKTRRNLNTD